MRRLSVDHSGKVEDTSSDTILAFHASDIQYSIRIPKDIKQRIFNDCKKKFRKKIILRIFSHGLYLLLRKRVNRFTIIEIDNEYPGHSRDIKAYLTIRLGLDKNQVYFTEIGKENGAHKIAYKTYSGKLKPNEIVTERILNLNSMFNKKTIQKLLK